MSGTGGSPKNVKNATLDVIEMFFRPMPTAAGSGVTKGVLTTMATQGTPQRGGQEGPMAEWEQADGFWSVSCDVCDWHAKFDSEGAARVAAEAHHHDDALEQY
jgi:hypothetical protein